jgi:hypothetical protein
MFRFMSESTDLWSPGTGLMTRSIQRCGQFFVFLQELRMRRPQLVAPRNTEESRSGALMPSSTVCRDAASCRLEARRLTSATLRGELAAAAKLYILHIR